MTCKECYHNDVCKYGENRSNGMYCTGDKCKQYKSTADVVEVVRCKDCRLRNTPDCAMWYKCSKCGGQWSWENNYDYCSYGERREG